MKIIDTSLSGVLLLEPKVYQDERGFFYEYYRKNNFSKDLGIDQEFVQDSHSCSRKNVLRGLHYQIQHCQGKLVRVTTGTVFDVVVDLRKNSSTFGQSESFELSAHNKRLIWIPAGFAHGFLALSETAEVLYKMTNYYAPQYERTLLWNDPDIKVNWPLQGEPILSAKDQAGKALKEAETFDLP